MSRNRLLLILLIVSPLIYSGPGNLRLIGALMIAFFCVIFLFTGHIRIRISELLFVLLYVITLMLQPVFVPGVWNRLVIGHSIFMIAMFVPAWAIYSYTYRFRDLEQAFAQSMNLLYSITVISIYISFFFNIGDIVFASAYKYRAFAWLGDRYTPVISLLIIYFSLQKSLYKVVFLLGALIMTGGKSATFLLLVSPLLYFLFAPISLSRKILITISFAMVGFVAYAYWDVLFASFFPGADLALTSRLLANKVGLIYFSENPWFGIGIDQSIYRTAGIMESFIESSGSTAYTMPRIHNAFLRTSAETGIFGLSALVGLCLIWTRRHLRIIIHAHHWPQSVKKNLVIAVSVWCIGFIWFYQTVDWFMGGENQLAFLLMFSSVSEAIFLRMCCSSDELDSIKPNPPKNIYPEKSYASVADTLLP
jgi:O-antigen ligase